MTQKKTEHYFTERPEGELKLRDINVNLRGFDMKFKAGSGTFSARKLDKGTYVLIQNAIIEKGWKVLDLGCGWGAVGVTMAKAGCEVMMSDINRRALEIAKMNCRFNKVRCKIKHSDGFSKIRAEFDCILLNPPQTAGRDVCYKMIEDAFLHTTSGGIFQIVARHKKGGAMLAKKMEEVYGNVDVVVKSSGFRVYVSFRSKI